MLPDAHQVELVTGWSYRLFPTALPAASQGQVPALCSCLFLSLLSTRVPVATTQQCSGRWEFAELLQLFSSYFPASLPRGGSSFGEGGLLRFAFAGTRLASPR